MCSNEYSKKTKEGLKEFKRIYGKKFKDYGFIKHREGFKDNEKLILLNDISTEELKFIYANFKSEV